MGDNPYSTILPGNFFFQAGLALLEVQYALHKMSELLGVHSCPLPRRPCHVNICTELYMNVQNICVLVQALPEAPRLPSKECRFDE